MMEILLIMMGVHQLVQFKYVTLVAYVMDGLNLGFHLKILVHLYVVMVY